MSEILAVDYAWDHPDPKSIIDAGYQVVLRYLSNDPSKNIDQVGGPNHNPSESKALHGAGLKIGLIWETTADRALDGGAAGLADAQTAVAQARAVGYTQGAVLFANVGDFAAQSNQLALIGDYYNNWRALVLRDGYKSGGYATSYIINDLAGHGDYYWQNAMDDGGVSGSVVNPAATIYQRVQPTTNLTGSFDENVILKPLPLWGTASIPPPAPSPTPAPNPYAPVPGATYPPFPGRLIYLTSPYMSGNDVRMWQEQMKARRWTIGVDGVYGPQSETVCKQFQTQKKLTVDGVVGPQTWVASWTYPVT